MPAKEASPCPAWHHSISEEPETADIAVIIPTHNRAAELQKALESVYNQTLKPRQIIVADDGSTDDTYSLMVQHDEVIYLRLAHSGLPGVARNRALHVASAEYVAFLDSDDTWHKDFLLTQSSYISRCPKAALFCTNAQQMPAGELFYPESGDRVRLLSIHDLLWRNRVIASTAVGKLRDVLDVGGFPEDPDLRAVEDYALWLKLALIGYIHYTPQPLCFYQTNSDNSVRKDRRKADSIRSLQKAIQHAQRYAIQRDKYGSCANSFTRALLVRKIQVKMLRFWRS